MNLWITWGMNGLSAADVCAHSHSPDNQLHHFTTPSTFNFHVSQILQFLAQMLLEFQVTLLK